MPRWSTRPRYDRVDNFPQHINNPTEQGRQDASVEQPVTHLTHLVGEGLGELRKWLCELYERLRELGERLLELCEWAREGLHGECRDRGFTAVDVQDVRVTVPSSPVNAIEQRQKREASVQNGININRRIQTLVNRYQTNFDLSCHITMTLGWT